MSATNRSVRLNSGLVLVLPEGRAKQVISADLRDNGFRSVPVSVARLRRQAEADRLVREGSEQYNVRITG